MFYLELFRALEAHGVEYLVVGGLAVNLHGIPRVTMDVDLALAMEAENLRAFIAAAESLRLQPVAPVPLTDLLDVEKRREWQEKKNMLAFSLRSPQATAPTVDVILDPSIDLPPALERALQIDIDGVTVRVAAVDDIIALKQAAGRQQDLADIEQLRRAMDRPDD